MLSFVLSSKLLLIAFLAPFFVYTGLCLFLYKRQHRIIFFPSPDLGVTPQDFNMPYEDVWIPVHESGKHSKSIKIERIHGWWIPSAHVDAEHADAKGLLYLHGNSDNMSVNASKAVWLANLGFSVLMIDYRGYGMSDGAFPNEARMYDDAEAGWTYLTQTLNMDAGNVVVFGHSLGGAIAIDLAIQHPEMAGLIVEGSFTSMLDMSHRTKNFGFLPIDWILTQRFDSLQKTKLLTMPVLYVHGTDDDIVPPDMSEHLYAATPSPKELLLVPGAGHMDVAVLGGVNYGRAIARLLEKTKHHARHRESMFMR